MISIGFITDMSGLYADIDGPAGAEAIRMAIADMGGAINGKKIEVLVADHQNKADVAAAKAREWFDTQGVDMLIGGTNSGTNLAMAKVAAEKKKPFIAVGARQLGADQRAVLALHRALRLRHRRAGQGHRQRGGQGRRQELVLPDRRLRLRPGAAERHRRGRQGGRRHGASARSSIRCRRATSRRSCCRRRVSKAQILGLANAGGDTINAIKAANEFGVTKTMKLAGLLMFINDVHSLGLKATQGMYLTDSWYWNQRRRDARLEPQVLREDQAHAVVAAGGRLLGGAAVT